MSWIRNNLVTIVEVVALIYDAFEVVVNGLARLIPGNATVLAIHDLLAKIDEPIKKLKSFLLGTNG